MIKLALLFALAAHAAPAKEKKVMEWKSQHGAPVTASHQLVTDAKGWEALWRVLRKDAPALDFKTHAAVAVFVGERPTGGWTVNFRKPRIKDGDTLIVYSIDAPKGFSTQAFTSSYVVRAVAKPAKGRIVVMETRSE